MSEQTNEDKGSHLLGLFFKEYDGRKIRKQPVNFKEISTIDRLNLNIITVTVEIFLKNTDFGLAEGL